MREINAVSPGELLKCEFLEPMRLSPEFLAREIGVSTQVIEDIVAGKESVSADMDLRLCRYFGLSGGYGPNWRAMPMYWRPSLWMMTTNGCGDVTGLPLHSRSCIVPIRVLKPINCSDRIH